MVSQGSDGILRQRGGIARLSSPWSSVGRARSSVVLRLLVSILLFSSVVTLLLTLLQLYREYEVGLGVIDSRLEDVDKSYVASIGEGLWRLDRQQLQLELDGILRLSDIRDVEVREITDTGTPMVVTAGRRQSHAVIAREVPIYYEVEGTARQIGTLYVEATLTGLYDQLFHTVLVILVTQALKTFLVSLFIIYIFHRLITRHLVAFARFVRNYDLRAPPPPFGLARNPRQSEDELDEVVAAFNATCQSLQRAYVDVRDREARIRRLVESNIIGIFLWDLSGNIIAANDAVLELVGYTRQDLLSGQVRWADMTPREYRSADDDAMKQLRARGSCRPYEKEFIRKDGTRVSVLLAGALFEESTHEGVAFVLDLTERKRAEARQKLLVDELNHRVKNTLATVQAIATQTLRNADTPNEFVPAFEGRLLALSQTHNLLTRNHWEGVALHDILGQELAPHLNERADRVLLAGGDIRLGPVAAVTLGMAFHELTTNAAKYGALSVPTGRVRVEWNVESSNRLHIDWEEEGGPPVPVAPLRRGFGSRLIERGLAKELAGEVHLDFMPEGVHCSMDMFLGRIANH